METIIDLKPDGKPIIVGTQEALEFWKKHLPNVEFEFIEMKPKQNFQAKYSVELIDDSVLSTGWLGQEIARSFSQDDPPE